MNDEEGRASRNKVLVNLIDTNDISFVMIGNHGSEDSVELEFAVNCSSDDLFEMFAEIFKDEDIKSEARKAILFSDYGNKNADSLNLN